MPSGLPSHPDEARLLLTNRAMTSSTVFLADDDDGLREQLRSTLREGGFRVVDLADGGRLLVAVARSLKDASAPRPDVVLADIHMPIMTGLAAAQALRDVSARVPTVLMTAFPHEGLRRHAGSLGVTLLEKPFSADALLGAVRSAITAPRR